MSHDPDRNGRGRRAEHCGHGATRRNACRLIGGLSHFITPLRKAPIASSDCRAASNVPIPVTNPCGIPSTRPARRRRLPDGALDVAARVVEQTSSSPRERGLAAGRYKSPYSGRQRVLRIGVTQKEATSPGGLGLGEVRIRFRSCLVALTCKCEVVTGEIATAPTELCHLWARALAIDRSTSARCLLPSRRLRRSC